MYQTKAWGLWLIAALSPFLLTKNPFYLSIAILVLGADFLALSRITTTSEPWSLLLRLSLFLALFGMIFNGLVVSYGSTTLLTLPVVYIPLGELVFQLGGAITLESLVYGLAQGLGMIGVLITLASFNLSVDHYELLRSAPRFMYQSSIVLSIAAAFVPQMIMAQAEIREAQILRGHRFRKIRDLAPLFVALLAQGLERSITLAESMSARGFGSPVAGARRASSALGAILAASLFILVCGIFIFSYWAATVGLVFLAVGGGMLFATLWSIGASVRSSRYKRVRWQLRDSVLAGSSLVVIAALYGSWVIDPALLYYYPYPLITWPPFQPVLASVLALLAFPALTSLRSVRDHD